MDRRAQLEIASGLPVGNQKRRKILAALAKTGSVKAKASKDIKLKSGGVLAKGTAVTITWPDDRRPSLARVVSSDLDFRISSKNLVGYFGRPFVKVPTISALMKMSNDGIVKSLTGERVEPDGYGNDGSPSWLLVLGYI